MGFDKAAEVIAKLACTRCFSFKFTEYIHRRIGLDKQKRYNLHLP